MAEASCSFICEGTSGGHTHSHSAAHPTVRKCDNRAHNCQATETFSDPTPTCNSNTSPVRKPTTFQLWKVHGYVGPKSLCTFSLRSRSPLRSYVTMNLSSKLEGCWFAHWRCVGARSRVAECLSNLSVSVLCPIIVLSDRLSSRYSRG